MIQTNPQSINDLVALHKAGVPVTLTSHPGNASLYKLVLWACGVPEHLWDVTCCKADANNWPMHRLSSGNAELLVDLEFYRRVMTTTDAGKRFVTAYQFAHDGTRLGRHHVRAQQYKFPNAISSCSRMLLTQQESLWEMFDYLARTRSEEVFSRYITPCGVMRPAHERRMPVERMATSFLDLLQELDKLLFSDELVETKGGMCYDGVMVQLSTMLVQYWQTGRVDRYDISGPDMIHYATRSEHQVRVAEMMSHLRKWDTKRVPAHVLVHMFPGTEARVGHVAGHVSEEVMRRKVHMLKNATSMDRVRKASYWEEAKHDESLWPIDITPSKERYFSQYDLNASQGEFVVDEFWKSIPIPQLRATLSRANNLLRL